MSSSGKESIDESVEEEIKRLLEEDKKWKKTVLQYFKEHKEVSLFNILDAFPANIVKETFRYFSLGHIKNQLEEGNGPYKKLFKCLLTVANMEMYEFFSFIRPFFFEKPPLQTGIRLIHQNFAKLLFYSGYLWDLKIDFNVLLEGVDEHNTNRFLAEMKKWDLPVPILAKRCCQAIAESREEESSNQGTSNANGRQQGSGAQNLQGQILKTPKDEINLNLTLKPVNRGSRRSQRNIEKVSKESNERPSGVARHPNKKPKTENPEERMTQDSPQPSSKSSIGPSFSIADRSDRIGNTGDHLKANGRSSNTQAMVDDIEDSPENPSKVQHFQNLTPGSSTHRQDQAEQSNTVTLHDIANSDLSQEEINKAKKLFNENLLKFVDLSAVYTFAITFWGSMQNTTKYLEFHGSFFDENRKPEVETRKRMLENTARFFHYHPQQCNWAYKQGSSDLFVSGVDQEDPAVVAIVQKHNNSSKYVDRMQFHARYKQKLRLEILEKPEENQGHKNSDGTSPGPSNRIKWEEDAETSDHEIYNPDNTPEGHDFSASSTGPSSPSQAEEDQDDDVEDSSV